MDRNAYLLSCFFRLITIGFALFLLFPPIAIFANDSVFDCIEDKEKCEENQNEGLVNDPLHSNDDSEEIERSPVGLTAGDYIKTLLALAFVVGLLYVLLKFLNKKNRLDNKNQMMRNLGGISLGQQKSIQLVVIGNTYYLVGVGDDITLLKAIDDEQEIEQLLMHYEEVEEIPFTGLFERILTKFSPFSNKKHERSETNEQDFSELLNHRLDEIKAERKNQIKKLTDKERGRDG